MAKQRIFGLDLMRAVAIMMVVFAHIRWVTPNANGVIPDIMSISGVMGVEIFFVLSGFLIGRILYRDYTSSNFGFNKIVYFWIRRLFRTLPNYYLALSVNIMIAFYIGYQLPGGLWRYFFFLQNFSTEMPWFFPESWSLSIEEFSYLIGPFLLYSTLFIKTNFSKSRLFLIVTLLIIVLFFVSKMLYNSQDTVRDMRHWNVNVKGMVIYRLDAIYYGVLGAYLSLVKPMLWKRFRYIGFVLAILTIICLNVLVPVKGIFISTHPMFWNVWYFVITSIAIFMALPLLSLMTSAPRFILKPITYISILSYAIYLLHYSIIMQLMNYFMPTQNFASFDIGVFIMVYLFLTMTLSYALYKFYEKPMMDIRDKPVFRQSIKQ